MSDNRRAFTRIPLEITASLRCGDQALECEVLNLSLSGVLLKAPTALTLGQGCALILCLGEGEGALELKAQGRIVRSEIEEIGVHFTEVDLDSFHHLRQLILYNAEAPEAVEAEFGQAAGLRRREALLAEEGEEAAEREES
ncbi:PilZ domain-containing protein [Myxococcota bacterium]|nr:PilZ domain-containing protein [Myxococcota bacterium]MBU1431835.1 PilZ domain-containing protein [Myxococcota bacterium]MBU1897951.1 PilZ domain-containing protein [Myxococcota bacterium]